MVRSSYASVHGYQGIIQLADVGQPLADPATTQRSIVIVGQRLNAEMMEELGPRDARALRIYQLLGLQAQLSTMAG